MDNEKKFPEQDAPAKNTDDAFVQVDENGSPAIPSAIDKKTNLQEEGSTTLDKR